MSEHSEKVASDAIMAMAKEMDAKDAEIERLRELLYEVWDKAPYLGADINKRVREALGE